MLKLYGGAISRASIVKWYLEELEVPYEYVMLDMKSGEHQLPQYLAINPMGKVPAIVDGDFQLWESGAILLYLNEKYGKEQYSVEASGKIAQWVLFSNSTFSASIYDEARRNEEMPRLMNPLNEILAQQPFLMGNQFSVADVAVGSVLAFALIMLKLDLSGYPNVINYCQRLSERPAFKKSMGGG